RTASGRRARECPSWPGGRGAAASARDGPEAGGPILRKSAQCRSSGRRDRRPRNGSASNLAPLFLGVDVGQGIGMHRRGGKVAGLTDGRAPFGAAEQACQLLGVELLGVCVRGSRGLLVGPEMHRKLEAGDAQMIVGQESSAANALAVDARAVGAAQVA